MTAGESIRKLAALGGPPLSAGEAILTDELRSLAGACAPELECLLALKNGFMAFESALHVFPCGGRARLTLEVWNSTALWRESFGNLTQGCLFFAQDALAGQFCIHEGVVWRFDPETGERDRLADGVDEWAGMILRDVPRLTAHPLARDWQLQNRPLSEGERLFARYPFVLGGEYSLSNLRCADAIAGMRFMGELATQIHDLPDGARVQIDLVD